LQDKHKKNLSKILFIVILLSFTISLVGCSWLSFGLLNIIDPQAQIRLNYTEIDLETGTINLEIYSINEVEFIGTGFEYKYYVGTTKINELSRTVGATFYVAPSTTPGTPGDITNIDNLPLYFQEVQDYITSNPLITELTCTINLVGTDGAGHNISKAVTVDLPAIQPGIDFEPPVAVINVTPGTAGAAPFTVVFDALNSTDNRGIASYSWNFGDGTSATGVMPAAHTYTDSGTYLVILTVTDFFGNVDTDSVTITVGSTGIPAEIILQAIPTTVTAGGGTSQIIATVKDSGGDPVPNGTAVTFSTTFGSLSSYSGVTSSGIATTVLTLTSAGNATVTAISGSLSKSVIVTCPASP
jgi:PKD repeat protein